MSLKNNGPTSAPGPNWIMSLQICISLTKLLGDMITSDQCQMLGLARIIHVISSTSMNMSEEVPDVVEIGHERIEADDVEHDEEIIDPTILNESMLF
jgi:hypothetical protein